jgi:ArsR family transcriptional regulator
MFKVTSLDVRPVSVLCKALGDETRVRIVGLLAQGELCVCHIEKALGLLQANASRQLAILRSAGIVEPRRDGHWTYYRLAEQKGDHRKRLLRAVVSDFGKQDVLREDVERVRKLVGPGSCR